jgi:hypothetical protein
MILAWILFLGVTLTAVEAETEPLPYGEEFGAIVRKVSIRLQKVAAKRPHKLTHLNDSLAKTAEAARQMASGRDLASVFELLREARRDYRDNHFAALLQAIASAAMGKESQANQLFEDYLLASHTFTGFEESFMKWGDFHLLRRSVYTHLQAKGISLEGKKDQIRARIPYEKLVQYAMGRGGEDFKMNIVFVAVLLIGLIFFILSAVTGVDFSRPIMSGLFTMYLVSWIAYAIWITDLAFGLPYGLSRFQVLPFLFGAPLTLLIVTWMMTTWNEHTRPLEAGYRRCRHCREVVMQITVQCPKCHGKIKG